MEARPHPSMSPTDSLLIRGQVVEDPPQPATFSGAGPPALEKQTCPRCPWGYRGCCRAHLGSCAATVLVEEQIRDTRRAMDAIIEMLSASEDIPLACEDTQTETEAHSPVTEETASRPPRRLHDVEILSSLLGVGNVILATLLSEASGLLCARNYPALRCLCGVPPVTRRSGKSRRVVRRRASQPRLINTVYHWSRVAIQHDPISKAK